MNKTKKIKMPEPIHIKKINTKLDFFSKTNVIRQWSGYDVIDTLFYLYLFNKYKQNCLIKYKGASSKHSLGLELQINTNLSRNGYSAYEKHLQMVSIKLSECIEKNPDCIIIPLYLKKSTGGHANILIYRKKDNVIEHFEPHGSKMITGNPQNNQSIETQLNLFIAMLNDQLKKNNKPPVNPPKDPVTPETTPETTLDIAGITEGIQVLAFTGLDPIIPISGGSAVIAGIAILVASLRRKYRNKKHD